MLALILPCVAANADYASAKIVDITETRNITIHPAGENEVEDGISPTTGRDLDLLSLDLPTDGSITGMALTGEYYPILVQHSGYAGDVRVGAPLYGSYADIYYVLPKSYAGHIRMMMLFNDFHPTYVGPSRSTRVGYLFIRQEWNAPYLYAGCQPDSWSTKYNTDVDDAINKTLQIADKNVVFDGVNDGRYNAYHYRLTSSSYTSPFNFVWNLQEMKKDVFSSASEYNFPNMAFKFTDEAPDGDDAETVYVMYQKSKCIDKDDANDPNKWYYYNTMFEWDEDDETYYAYKMAEFDDPQRDAVLFQERIIEDAALDADKHLVGNVIDGEPITFSNIIVLCVDDPWTAGECPYPIVTGTGNAEYFIGGKHISGVWNKPGTEKDGKRTVYYDENGEEISLLPGRTIIFYMDLYSDNSTVQKTRELRYE